MHSPLQVYHQYLILVSEALRFKVISSSTGSASLLLLGSWTAFTQIWYQKLFVWGTITCRRCATEACWRPFCAHPMREKRVGRSLQQGGGERSTWGSRSDVSVWREKYQWYAFWRSRRRKREEDRESKRLNARRRWLLGGHCHVSSF